MRTRLLAILALLAMPLAGCDFPGAPSGGGLAIVRTNADPSATSVKPGQSVTLSVETTRDGQANLLYSWSATGGTLSAATGNPVRWTAPAGTPGTTYRVEVTVSDGTAAAVAAYRFTLAQ